MGMCRSITAAKRLCLIISLCAVFFTALQPLLPAAASQDVQVAPFSLPGVKNGGGVNGSDLPKTPQAAPPKGCDCLPFIPAQGAFYAAAYFILRRKGIIIGYKRNGNEIEK